MDWDDVRHFLAVCRAGSIRAAGSQLGVSHSTVARRIDALEKQLSTRLFDRHRDGYTLTDAGERMRLGAVRVEAEMSAIERGLVGQDARLDGPVHITCTDPFIADLLLGPLHRLCAEHPGIELHLDCDRRYRDLARREADIGVRAVEVGEQPDDHLIGTPLAPIVLATYVSANGPTENQWVGHSDIELQKRLIAHTHGADLPIWGALDNMALLASAARRGLGRVLLPTYVGDPDSSLQRTEPADLFHGADLWLVSHPDVRTTARFRVVRKLLVETFEVHRALFDGTGPKLHSGGAESVRARGLSGP